MSITWGIQRTGGGNGMEVGIEVVLTSATSTRQDYYVRPQFNYSGDVMTINETDAYSGSDGFTLTASGGDIVKVASHNKTVSPGSTYTFGANVTGYYNTAMPTPSVSVSFTVPPVPPSTPGNPNWRNLTQTAVEIYWAAPSDWGGDDWRDADSGRYDVRVATDSAFTQNVQTQNSGDAIGNFSGLIPNKLYYYECRAKNDAGFSSWTPNNRVFTTKPNAPAAPSGASGTRVSDTQINLGWTNNATATAPYDSISITRHDNTVPDAGVGSLAGNATSFSDTKLRADRKFSYDIIAKNSTSSAKVTTAPVYTTPAAVSGVAASKASGDITVAWTNNSTYKSETPIEVWHSTDGGATSTLLATTAAGATSYTHVAPATNQTHTYLVRPKSPTGGLYGSYATSNTVVLEARPNAPTGLVQSNQAMSGSTLDPAFDTTLGWTYNSADSSAQTAYEIEYQVSSDNGATWAAAVTTGKILSSTKSRLYAAATWEADRTIRWHVRTWGSYNGTEPTYSDWSAWSQFWTSGSPTGTITSPSSGNSSSYTATGTYYDPEGSAQASVRWVLRALPSGNELERLTTSDSAEFASHTFAYQLRDSTSYEVALQVQDGAGLWSRETTQQVDITYSKPATPILTLAFENGAITGTVENPPVQPRTNLVPNPSFETGIGGWYAWGGSSGAASLSQGTSGGSSGTNFLRETFTTLPTSGGGFYTDILPGMTAGTQYTISAYVRPSVTLNVQPQYQFYDGAGTATSGGGGSVTACPANVWTRVSVTTAAVPAGSSQIQLRFYISGTGITATGQTLDIDAVMLESGTILGDYIDGDSADTVWNGARGNSTSTFSLPDAIFNQVYRDGVLLDSLAEIPPNGSFSDPLPVLGSSPAYTVIAYSNLPSASVESDPVTVSTDTKGAAFLNGGLGMATAVRIGRRPKLGVDDSSLEKVLVTYDQREDPVQYAGTSKNFSGDISGLATPDELNALEELVNRPEPGCWRDPFGRKVFISLLGIKYDDGAENAILKPFTIKFRRTSYAE